MRLLRHSDVDGARRLLMGTSLGSGLVKKLEALPVQLVFDRPPAGSPFGSGSYVPEMRTIFVDDLLRGHPDLLAVQLAHEGTHAIQHAEGRLAAHALRDGSQAVRAGMRSALQGRSPIAAAREELQFRALGPELEAHKVAASVARELGWASDAPVVAPLHMTERQLARELAPSYGAQIAKRVVRGSIVGASIVTAASAGTVGAAALVAQR